jgi:hypothetical protein
VPLVLLTPTDPNPKPKPRPIVVAFAQQGKQRWLRERSEAAAELLRGGVALCLPDLRGTGEARVGDGRGRTGEAAALAADEWMLGQTLLGAQLRDLRAVLRYVRTRPDIDGRRIALWGDSLAQANSQQRDVRVPHGVDPSPSQCEPMGAAVALLAALYEDRLAAVAASGGLSSFQSALASTFCYVPADAVVPGVLTVCDVADVVAALAPRPVRLERLVDGHNRQVSDEDAAQTLAPAIAAFRAARTESLSLPATLEPSTATVQWLIARLTTH